jgi:hypothetical protein
MALALLLHLAAGRTGLAGPLRDPGLAARRWWCWCVALRKLDQARRLGLPRGWPCPAGCHLLVLAGLPYLRTTVQPLGDGQHPPAAAADGPVRPGPCWSASGGGQRHRLCHLAQPLARARPVGPVLARGPGGPARRFRGGLGGSPGPRAGCGAGDDLPRTGSGPCPRAGSPWAPCTWEAAVSRPTGTPWLSSPWTRMGHGSVPAGRWRGLPAVDLHPRVWRNSAPYPLPVINNPDRRPIQGVVMRAARMTAYNTPLVIQN